MSDIGLSTALQSAIQAFSSDVSYAVAVVSAAMGIKKKRLAWGLRTDLRRAETNARKLCADSEPFICMTQSPCGTGSCKFSQDEFALLNVPKCKGSTQRPQKFTTGKPYSIDAALIPLSELRASIVK